MIIETYKLTKIYGNRPACTEICLSVPEGQVFGFLGPNGAGKSTLVKMLVGLVHPTAGSATILGLPLGSLQNRRQIGFLPENFRYQEWLTARQLLQYHCDLYGMPKKAARIRIAEVIELVRLSGREQHRVGTYSKGMQQRLGLAAALLPEPKLLFLDEPTSALDPVGRIEVREIILALKERGTAVFLNSHLLTEVEQVCDAVAVIKKGRIVACAAMAQLVSANSLEVVLAEVSPAVEEALAARSLAYTIDGSRLVIENVPDSEIPEVARLIVQNGGRLYKLDRAGNRLESTFLRLLQEGDD